MHRALVAPEWRRHSLLPTEPCPDECRNMANAVTRCCADAYAQGESESDYNKRRGQCEQDIWSYEFACGGFGDCPVVSCPEWDKGCDPKDDSPDRLRRRLEYCRRLTADLKCPGGSMVTLCLTMLQHCSCTSEQYKQRPFLGTWCAESGKRFGEACHEKANPQPRKSCSRSGCKAACDQVEEACDVASLISCAITSPGGYILCVATLQAVCHAGASLCKGLCEFCEDP